MRTLKELLKIRAEIDAEIAAILNLDSMGNLTGNIAEYLVKEALGGELTKPNEKGCDLILENGEKIEIKSDKSKSPALTTGAIRNLDQNTFDYMVVVEFNNSYEATRVFKVPHAIVDKFASKETLNKPFRKLTITKKVIAEPSVLDITSMFN